MLPTPDDAKAPRIRLLSTRTVLITLLTFDDRYAPLIEALIKAHRPQIALRPYLVIDVRRNNGGSDASYASLLPFLDANITRSIGAEFLSTPANIAASEAVCKLPAMASKACETFMAPVLQAMKAAPSSSYVLPESEHAMSVRTPHHVLANPRRIAVWNCTRPVFAAAPRGGRLRRRDQNSSPSTRIRRRKSAVTGPLRMISYCALSAPRAPHSTRGIAATRSGARWRSGLLLSRTLRNCAVNCTGLRMMRVLSSG